MQIKTTQTHNFTPTRMAVIRETDTNAKEKLEPARIASENVKSTETSEHSFAVPR